MLSRFLVLLLTIATGFSGLVYEVVWQKYLAILLGSHSEATAAVLGIFLAGLAGGYALFGAVTRRTVASGRGPQLLWIYALVEGAIGVYALVFPWLFHGARWVSLAGPAGTGTAFAFDVCLTALLLGPPTVLMGGTIPILTQALARDLREATRVHAWVYAFNTAGAFGGALAAGFVLIPALGLDVTLRALAAVNLGAAAVLFWLGRPGAALRRAAAAQAGGAEPSPHLEGQAGYAAVAALTGFAMMALQTVVIRVGGLAFGASGFTFSMVVAAFVLCIAIGSGLVSLLRRVPAIALVGNQWLLAICVVFLYARLEEAPYWVHVLRSRYGTGPADFSAFYRDAFLWLLVALGPVVVLSGAALPLLFHHARRRVGDLGVVAGRLYAWNTLGSLAGALLGGYALLFWFDLDDVCRLAVAALLAGAVLLVPLLFGRRAAAAAALLAMGGVAGLWMLEPWDPRLLSSGLFRARQALPDIPRGPLATALSVRRGASLVFYDDDPTASVTVNQWDLGGGSIARSLLTNGKPDGSTRGDYPTMALTGLIPALLAESAERVFVIGYGTGVTAGELAVLDDVDEVVVAEISGGVLEAAPLFDFANHGASRNPKIRVIRSDAYRALLRTPGSFDLILSEPSNPWVSGVEMLYSREFLAAAREKLAPGGIYAQWYHQYETDPASIELVLRTFSTVFEDMAIWYSGYSDLLLLGFRDPDRVASLDTLLERLRRPEIAAGLARAGVESPAELLAHELLPQGSVRAEALPGPLHTLTHPRLGHLAARAFFRGRSARLPFAGYGAHPQQARERSLLARFLARAPAGERPRLLEEIARESCSHRLVQCAAWLAAASHSAPASPSLDALRERALASKELFAGRLRPDTLEILGEFYGAPDGETPLSPAQAQLRSWFFWRFFQTAAPFQPEALLDAWDRCESPEEPEACRSGLARARRMLESGEAPVVLRGPPRADGTG